MRLITRLIALRWLIAGILLISLVPPLSARAGHPYLSPPAHRSHTIRPAAKPRRLVAGAPASRPSVVAIGTEPFPGEDSERASERLGNGSRLADDCRQGTRPQILPCACVSLGARRSMRC
jgi:hypothetical protein